MEGLNKYIAELKKIGFKEDECLSKDIDEEQLEKLDKMLNGLLSADFKKLYSTYNGEVEYVSFIAGLEFLSIERVLDEFEYFKSSDYEYEPIGTDAISEAPACENVWVPFAFDSSECFFALDLSPSDKGKTGQIIAIDMGVGHDSTYLMADSLNEFFERMAAWVNEGKLFINDEDEYICEESGHIFNNISEFAKMKESAASVDIVINDDFWIKKCEKDIKQDPDGNKIISSDALAKITGAFRVTGEPVNISCKPFQYMDKVKELVIHDSELRDFEYLCKMPELTTLYIIECKIIGADLSMLAECPKLKRLSIRLMGDNESIRELAKIKTLKELSISDIEGFDYSVLGDFTGLTSLSFKFEEGNDPSFLSNLKKMKKLDINVGKDGFKNLDFILDMPKLEELKINKKADDESALSGLSKLNKLKLFGYPVTDLNVYKDHPSIVEIGLSYDNNGAYQVFEGSNINSFMLYTSSDGDVMSEEIKAVAKSLGEYVKLSSYGGTVLG